MLLTLILSSWDETQVTKSTAKSSGVILTVFVSVTILHNIQRLMVENL